MCFHLFPSLLPIRGHRKNRREGRTETCDRVGGKNMASGSGTTWKNREGVGRENFWRNISEFFFLTQKVNKNSITRGMRKVFVENMKTSQFLWVREGVKSKKFSISPIGWSENGLREGDLLEGKSAYGHPPPPPPLCPRMLLPLFIRLVLPPKKVSSSLLPNSIFYSFLPAV